MGESVEVSPSLISLFAFSKCATANGQVLVGVGVIPWALIRCYEDAEHKDVYCLNQLLVLR